MEKMYKRVVTGNHYDYEKANKHHSELISQNVKAKDMPSIETAFISANHYGCCLHYGMALYKLMKDTGIETYISITLEESPVTHQMTDSHVSVYYIKNGKEYIAKKSPHLHQSKHTFYIMEEIIMKIADTRTTIKEQLESKQARLEKIAVSDYPIDSEKVKVHERKVLNTTNFINELE